MQDMFMQALQAFRQALEQAGLVPDSIIADGQIYRCGTAGKERGADGAYLFHNTPPYGGWYKNYRTGDEGTWSMKGDTTLSHADQERYRRQAQEENARRLAERQAGQAKVAMSARQALASLPVAGDDNPYLRKKGVKAAGDLRTEEKALVVPVLNAEGQLQSLQHIYPDGVKRFLKGGKTQGGYFPIKGNDGAIFIVEGVATGLTVHEATGNTVLCAFNAGNMEHVARIAREIYPTREIVIAGDNDQSTANNPGLTKARKAAQATGAMVVVPDFPDGTSGTDFNDVHVRCGIEEVRMQLKNMEAVRDEASSHLGSAQAPGSTRPPEDFPLGIIPRAIEKALVAAAEAFVVPLAVPCMAFLVAAAAAIGRSRSLMAKKGWEVCPNLFVALVAESGMGKTPCTSRIFKVLQQKDYRHYQIFLEEKEEYEVALQSWKSSKGKSSDALGERPSLPKQTELLVDDATMEKVAHVLEANPRGILWYRDELSGLINDLGKYAKNGKGDGDKARLLSAYSVGPWKSSRATKDGVYIRAACITLFGTIQPQIVLHSFEKDDRYSGLLQRFIFINTEKNAPALWTDKVFDDETAGPVDNVLEYLLGLKLSMDETPCAVTFSDAGRAAVIDKYNRMECEVENSPEHERFKSLVPKQREQLFKFCLILHLLHCWENGTPDSTPVSVDTVGRAALLMDWVIAHQRHTWDMFDGKTIKESSSTLAKRVGKTIVELEHKIVGGVLLATDIAAQLNANLPPEYHVSTSAIGKTYRKLGLLPGRGKSGNRGVNISPEQLEGLKCAQGKGKTENSSTALSPLDAPGEGLRDQEWDGKNEVII